MTKLPIDAYIGVDGGGTRTRATLIDSQGRVLAEGAAAGSNPSNVGYEIAAFRIDAAIRDAIRKSKTPIEQVLAAFLGIAGIRNEDEQSLLRSRLTRYSWAPRNRLAIDHDLSIAYAATIKDAPGIVLICGTGTSAFGKDAQGNTARASGRDLGPNDPGSGYAIGKAAVDSGLLSISETDRTSVSALAPRVLDAALKQDSTAIRILQENAQSLVDLASSVFDRLALEDAFRIGLSGTLGTIESIYRDFIFKELRSAFSEATIETASVEPVYAAALKAMKIRAEE